MSVMILPSPVPSSKFIILELPDWIARSNEVSPFLFLKEELTLWFSSSSTNSSSSLITAIVSIESPNWFVSFKIRPDLTATNGDLWSFFPICLNIRSMVFFESFGEVYWNDGSAWKTKGQ